MINLVNKLVFIEVNAVYKFIDAILEEYNYCKRVMNEHFNKNLIMSAEDEERIQLSNKCWICNKLLDQCCIQMYFGTVWTVWAPKKVLTTLFPYIVHVKTKWNIVYKNLKTKIFSRDTNILPQMHWTSNIFGPPATTIGGFWVSLNYPILNFKKTVCPKNVWIWHCWYRR